MQVKEAVEIDKKNLVGSGIDRFWIDFFAPWRIKEPNEIFPHGNVSNDIEVLNANISFLSGDLEISVRKLDLNHMYIICEGTEEGTLLYNYTRKSK